LDQSVYDPFICGILNQNQTTQKILIQYILYIISYTYGSIGN